MIITCFIGVSFASCNLAKTDKSTNLGEHTSQNSLDWKGTYYGVTPCASCPGIETELTLMSDQDFILTQSYMDSEEIDTVKGKFNWEGNKIKLEGSNKGDASWIYKIEEGKVRQLDLQGNEVRGELAQYYILTKKR